METTRKKKLEFIDPNNNLEDDENQEGSFSAMGVSNFMGISNLGRTNL